MAIVIERLVAATGEQLAERHRLLADGARHVIGDEDAVSIDIV